MDPIISFSSFPRKKIFHGIGKSLAQFDSAAERQIVSGEQVHKATVMVVTDPSIMLHSQTDGLVTNIPGISLVIKTADCLPIFLHDEKRNIVGLLHAGYKGLLAGIIDNGIKAFQTLGSNTKHIRVAIGPAICTACYPVSEERVGEFLTCFPHIDGLARKWNDQYYLDLVRIAEQELIYRGIKPSYIERSEICTKEETLLYSRRGGDKKDNISIIELL